MIPLRLPADHPHSTVIQNWARDKENILNNHIKDIARLKGMVEHLLAQSKSGSTPGV